MKRRKRYNIVYCKLCVENAIDHAATYVEWLSEFPSLLANEQMKLKYSTRNILQKGCIWRWRKLMWKQSKLCRTVLMTENRNRKAVINLKIRDEEKIAFPKIWQSKKPRCFAKVKSFLIPYKWNIKVWIRNIIFADWLIGIS